MTDRHPTREEILVLGAFNAMTVLEYAVKGGHFKPTWDTLAFMERFYEAMDSPETMIRLLGDPEAPGSLKQLVEMVISTTIFHGFRAMQSMVSHLMNGKDVPPKIISAGIYIASLDAVATEVDVFKAHGAVMNDLLIQRLDAVKAIASSPNKTRESVEAALRPLFRGRAKA